MLACKALQVFTYGCSLVESGVLRVYIGTVLGICGVIRVQHWRIIRKRPCMEHEVGAGIIFFRACGHKVQKRALAVTYCLAQSEYFRRLLTSLYLESPHLFSSRGPFVLTFRGLFDKLVVFRVLRLRRKVPSPKFTNPKP